MTEEDPPVGRHEVAAVVEALGRRRALRIELEDLLRDEPRVEAIRNEIRADRGDDEPGRADRLAAFHGDVAERARASHRDGHPHCAAQKSIHFNSQLPNPNAQEAGVT